MILAANSSNFESCDFDESHELEDDPNEIWLTYKWLNDWLKKSDAHLSNNQEAKLGLKIPRRRFTQITMPMTQLLHQLRELGTLNFKPPPPSFKP